MTNELIFIIHSIVISSALLFFARLGRDALIAYISLVFVISNIFVIKQISLFGWYATSADAFIIGISFGINLLQEFWGKEVARKSVWISLAGSLFYMIMSQFLLWYSAVPEDFSQCHFEIIMSNTPRIILASFVSYIITQISDTYLYAYLKNKTKNRYFIIRNYASICSSQLFDTIIFSYIGLYGIVPNIPQLIVVSYLIKLSIILLTTPFLILAKQIVKKEKKIFNYYE